MNKKSSCMIHDEDFLLMITDCFLEHQVLIHKLKLNKKSKMQGKLLKLVLSSCIITSSSIKSICIEVKYYYTLFFIKSVLFIDRKSTRLNSSHVAISYAVFCLKKKKILIYIK